MIRAVFSVSNSLVTGFTISGHADYSEQGIDIVCAAVSSAAVMAVNTLTEVQELSGSVTADDGFLEIKLSDENADKAQVVLNGLLLHLDALSKQYAEFIDLKISEV